MDNQNHGNVARRMSLYRRFGKRGFDIVGAIVILPIVALVSIVVAPVIKINDGGPIFFTGERRGRYGRSFTMYKFRSMHVNAPDRRNTDFSTFNSESDSRVTSVGRVLRATSIDELPQILNVLRGDMSFIGPRPNMTRQRQEDLVEIERKRLEVRPGITGLAQAMYRNAATTSKKYETDAYYVEHLSLGLDLKILAKTVATVAMSKSINSDSRGGLDS